MKRVILDTNIYGRIVEKREVEEIQKIAESRNDVVIYGFEIIRTELRNTSKEIRIDGKLIRLMLLGLYDRLVKSHVIHITNPIEQLASDYYKIYKELGGPKKEKEIMNDFLIVACACINELDIVVSEDNRTMMSDKAFKTYRIANTVKNYKMPNFIDYQEFRRLFS